MVTEAFAVENLRVRFGAQVALDGVSMVGQAGEIVALAGENGAGKSTLVKVLSGVHPVGAYEGSVRVAGREQRFSSSADASRAGVVLVPQELAIVPHLSVAANVLLGREPRRGPFLDDGAAIDRTRALLQQFGIAIDPRQRAGELSVPQQQLVEIARALSQDASVLVLDEPTAALTAREAARLFDRLRALRDAGLCSVYITHRLDELHALADRVVVLRDGRMQLDAPITQLQPADVVQAMVGRTLASALRQHTQHDRREALLEGPSVSRDPSLLELKGWSAKPRGGRGPGVYDVDLVAHRGEVLGIYGPIGAGRTELLRSIVGAHDGPLTGVLRLDGEVRNLRTPAQALAAGIAFVSEDRKALGLEPFLNLRENITLSALDDFVRGGFVDRVREAAAAEASAASVGIRARPEQPIGTLSGGNQQKALLARALLTRPRLLLLDEPTRGIDVGAKADIVTLLRDWAAEGVAIVVVSSEAEELVGAADRIIVLRHGHVVAERLSAATDVDELLRLATGAQEAAA